MSRLFIFLLVPLLGSCAANIGAVPPFALALSSCSTQADMTNMVPENLADYSAELPFEISDVRVVGPLKKTIPPPVMAAAYKQALEKSLSQSGFIIQESKEVQYYLTANLVAQNRQGTFKTTTLELIVEYSLTSRDEPEKIYWTHTVSTTGQLDDWKTDACMRLRQLQEELSARNIQQLIDHLLLINDE